MLRISRAVVFAVPAFVLVGCGGGGGGPPPPPPSSSPWQIVNSVGMPATMAHNPTAYVLSFPQCSAGGRVDYVYENSLPVVAGKTVAMSYAIAGAGTLSTPGDSPPATLHLFLQRAGDDYTGQGAAEFYRLWSAWTALANGSFKVSQVLSPALWTGVFGRSPSAAQFADTLGHLAHIGFTFGGHNFAGHGVCAVGARTFALTGYAVR